MPFDVSTLLEGEQQLINSTPSNFDRDVTDYLQLLLRKSGHSLYTTAEKEIVRTIKEKCCYVALSPLKEEKESGGQVEEYKLPDGNSIMVGYL